MEESPVTERSTRKRLAATSTESEGERSTGALRRRKKLSQRKSPKSGARGSDGGSSESESDLGVSAFVSDASVGRDGGNPKKRPEKKDQEQRDERKEEDRLTVVKKCIDQIHRLTGKVTKGQISFNFADVVELKAVTARMQGAVTDMAVELERAKTELKNSRTCQQILEEIRNGTAKTKKTATANKAAAAAPKTAAATQRTKPEEDFVTVGPVRQQRTGTRTYADLFKLDEGRAQKKAAKAAAAANKEPWKSPSKAKDKDPTRETILIAEKRTEEEGRKILGLAKKRLMNEGVKELEAARVTKSGVVIFRAKDQEQHQLVERILRESQDWKKKTTEAAKPMLRVFGGEKGHPG